MTITINPQAADVITISISDADQITLNTTAIVFVEGGGSGGGDADTLQGENGAYYLSRANHTGSQAISTVTGLQTALDAKLDIVDYNDRFLGLYASILELETAHPTANAGDYAQVDWGIGADVIVYVYDVDDAQWIPVGSSPIANTDALPEGSSNLYFNSQRVRDTLLTGLSTATATPISAADSLLSAAGKLQAQINTVSPPPFFYRSGQEYNQDINAGSTNTQNLPADRIALIPVRVFEDVLIDRFSINTRVNTPDSLTKVSLYAAELAGANYSLSQIIPQFDADTSNGNTLFSFDVNVLLQANRMYFFAIKSNLSRAYLSVATSNALALGYIGESKVTHFLVVSPFSDDLPETLSTAGSISGLVSPTQFRFRVASL